MERLKYISKVTIVEDISCNFQLRFNICIQFIAVSLLFGLSFSRSELFSYHVMIRLRIIEVL
jgi:hypothetical protein